MEVTVTEKTKTHLIYPGLGNRPSEDYTEFRFFCPRASRVYLELFETYDQQSGKRFPMNLNGGGIWQLTLKGNHFGKYYGYRIMAPKDLPNFEHTNELIADPFGLFVTARNHHLQYPKTLILKPEPFDWDDDTFVVPEDHRDLIIYEAHLKDLTAHPSAVAGHPGGYLGLAECGTRGGLSHLKDLGINALELLPLQKFPLYEPAHNEPISEGVLNTWNHYGRNYWGYMTSFFFAPETIFASDGTTKPGAVIGATTAAITEFKLMVKSLHSQGIAVIMDVVYNHVSQYDLNPLKYIDQEYFFRLNPDGTYRSESGCGNDLKTEAPVARQLIIESLKYWMQEYHIDGFRFDLANLIDRDTAELIKKETRAVNPNVVLIAEPWGGGYDPNGFSAMDWAAWNDQIRNGVKGSDPVSGKGFIFGGWQYETSREALENFMTGTLWDGPNGRFAKPEHSVNYLESHDGYTLGDFVRIGYDRSRKDAIVNDISDYTRLSKIELRSAKLAALFLLTAQGIPMLHAGQEWARAKIIRKTDVDDPNTGLPDHNSYEKDNETNYLNYEEIALNQPLYDYYKGLISLRKSSPALRRSDPDDIDFTEYYDALFLTCIIRGKSSGDNYDYLISMNANNEYEQELHLPEGTWELLVTDQQAGDSAILRMNGMVWLAPLSGLVARKLRS
ncbi:MAG: alpha-amylase family glycosyl hydrolase [Cyclonatronaceae bacterium]